MRVSKKHLAVMALALGTFAAAGGQEPNHDAGPDLHGQDLHSQDAKQIVQQVVTTELTAGAADTSLWRYHEVDKTPKRRVTQWVAQTSQVDLPRVVEENDQKLTEAQQRQKMESFLKDKGAQARERKKRQDDLKQTADLVKLLPQAFLWTVTDSHGGESTLHFKPDPSFHPPNIEARILAGVEGDMVVNMTKHRIVSLKGKLVHDVKFGGGLLGEIKSGGDFEIERQEVGAGVWQIMNTHVHMTGHLLLFKSVSEQEDDEKASFKQLPADLSLEQAQNELLQAGDLAKN